MPDSEIEDTLVEEPTDDPVETVEPVGEPDAEAQEAEQSEEPETFPAPTSKSYGMRTASTGSAQRRPTPTPNGCTPNSSAPPASWPTRPTSVR
jgi:hypothetical protein